MYIAFKVASRSHPVGCAYRNFYGYNNGKYIRVIHTNWVGASNVVEVDLINKRINEKLRNYSNPLGGR